MFSIKNSAQPPVFIAFFPLITIPTAKSGFKENTPQPKSHPTISHRMAID
jgi:hypothetical protein